MDAGSSDESATGKRRDYYAPRFERFARGGWLSWNTAAFVATLAWLRYRKLYGWSWLYFFFSTPMLVVAYLLAVSVPDPCARALDPPPAWIMAAAGAMAVVLLLVQWLVAPLVANRLYFNRVRSRVGTADFSAGTGPILRTLALQASLVLVPFLVLPLYANYDHRAIAGEGITMATNVQRVLRGYLNEHPQLPPDLGDIWARESGRYVERLVVEPDGTIGAIYGARARKLAGHSVSFVPVREDGRLVGWSCQSIDIPAQCLPARCETGARGD